MLQIVELSFIALVLSCLGVAGVRRWAERHQILDIPNERSSHTRPIPRGGGLPIVIVTLAGVIFSWLRDPAWAWPALLAYGVGAGLISVISGLDDLHSLPNCVRFAAHSLGAILAILGFGYWYTVSIPFLGPVSLGWLGLPVTFLWLVGLTNAYNFMDGIDGIAGGQGVVAGLGWGLLGWQAESSMVTALGLLLAVCSLGFLWHNWPPARIFMGDVGSAFLGYSFAVLAVVAAQSDSRLVVAGVLLVGPFVFDTVFTFLRRLWAGENVFTAHRSHLYQRLVIAGHSHRSVTLLYAGLAFVITLLALSWSTRIQGADAVLLVAVLAICFALWLWVIWQERRHCLRLQPR
jgi:UDP-N-acetylmuramyl pentapeptide phosphotransferase/UDP-N-acetylglucosamine-1-phosphate transferase